MWNQDELVSLELTPGTNVPVSQFYEIDRSLVIRLPFEWQYLLDARVNLHKRAWTQERVERSVLDRKSTRLNSSHRCISYAVFCLKKKKDRGQRNPAHGRCIADKIQVRVVALHIDNEASRR